LTAGKKPQSNSSLEEKNEALKAGWDLPDGGPVVVFGRRRHV